MLVSVAIMLILIFNLRLALGFDVCAKGFLQRLLGSVEFHEVALLEVPLLVFLFQFQFLFDYSGELPLDQIEIYPRLVLLLLFLELEADRRCIFAILGFN